MNFKLLQIPVHLQQMGKILVLWKEQNVFGAHPKGTSFRTKMQ
jgi:hypothetical protein